MSPKKRSPSDKVILNDEFLQTAPLILNAGVHVPSYTTIKLARGNTGVAFLWYIQYVHISMGGKGSLSLEIPFPNRCLPDLVHSVNLTRT